MKHFSEGLRNLLRVRSEVEKVARSFINNDGKTMPTRAHIVAVALSLSVGLVDTACLTHRTANDPKVPSKQMPDGKHWTTDNLKVVTDGSYCYQDVELNCGRYGRLYTWEAAQRGCQSLGDGWRLPTDDDWRQMAKFYGGVRDDSDDNGHAAYRTLLAGGSSGFDAVLGGGRAEDSQYARLEAHGFYWTASDSGQATASFYNFGKGESSLNRQRGGNKQMALAVRCISEW